MSSAILTLDSIQHFKAVADQYPVLSGEEEHRLAVEFKKTKSKEIANILVLSNLRFVMKIANEYRGYDLSMIDMYQEGVIGLMVAIEKFNPNQMGGDGKPLRLVGYAIHYIRRWVQKYIIDTWSLLKIDTSIPNRRLFFNINKHTESGKLDPKICEEMSVRMGREHYLQDTYNKHSADNDITYQDMLRGESLSQEEQLIDLQEEHNVSLSLTEALAKLTVNERRVIEKRYLAEEKAKFKDLADELNVSKQRVDQIGKNALRKLKLYMSV